MRFWSSSFEWVDIADVVFVGVGGGGEVIVFVFNDVGDDNYVEYKDGTEDDYDEDKE